VLTDWNGLALQALAEAGRSLHRPDWIELAGRIFGQLISTRDEAGRLPHSVRADRRLYPAFTSDYAAMTNAAVSLYEATSNENYLKTGLELISLLDRWHADDAGLGHYLTASDSADVPIRMRGDVDEAVHSANAQLIEAFARLASATGDYELGLRTEKIAERAIGRIRDQQYGQAGIVNAAAIALNPVKLVLVDEQEGELVAVANRIPDPRRVDILYDPGQAGEVPELTAGVLPTIQERGAWLCMNQTCLPVITAPNELARALSARTDPV
jgi:uncharacterized protein YyaL (SSP411 family)